MRKLLSILYIFVLFLSINSFSNNFFLIAQTSVDVESVSFSKDVVFMVCPIPDWMSSEITDSMACSEKNTSVKVSAKTSANDNNDFTYYYTVSTGKIIGSGSEVIWDLSKIPPGRYSITVGVGKDNIIGGKTLTKYITVEDCHNCDPPCICPASVEVFGPKNSILEGDLVVFSSSVGFPDKENSLIYNWKITNGEIIEGQGTKQILVRTNQNSADKTVTATLEVTNSECECPSIEAKTTVNISKKD